MPAKIIGLHPRAYRPGVQWVYLFGVADGSIKVGQTKHIRSRLSQQGLGKMCWYHSGPCGDAYFAWRLEVELIRLFGEVGERVRRTERFFGLTKVKAIAILHEQERVIRDLCSGRAARLPARDTGGTLAMQGG